MSRISPRRSPCGFRKAFPTIRLVRMVVVFVAGIFCGD
jgi:hypothetical protein